jgi:hypothetical protein
VLSVTARVNSFRKAAVSDKKETTEGSTKKLEKNMSKTGVLIDIISRMKQKED